jgi:hypothetical protein
MNALKAALDSSPARNDPAPAPADEPLPSSESEPSHEGALGEAEGDEAGEVLQGAEEGELNARFGIDAG